MLGRYNYNRKNQTQKLNSFEGVKFSSTLLTVTVNTYNVVGTGRYYLPVIKTPSKYKPA